MEPSEEIRRVIERWTMAIAISDGDSALGRLSEHSGTLMIGMLGPDPTKLWKGSETRAIWARQLVEIGPFPVMATEIQAWEEGTVGWAGVKETINWEGQALESLATYVLHLERGEWKIVHVHWSYPQANLEALGLSVAESIDEFAKSLEREQPDLSASLAVDGTVTIVFTDIVDSTVLLARLGDRAWVDVIRLHNQVVEKVTADHAGAVVETQGDGSLLAFSSAREAVACSVAIQQAIQRAFADASAPIRVRIGIHTGDAIKEAEHFYGTTVHYAARVASHALGGEVLVSSAVRELVIGSSSDVDFLEAREVDLKGIAGRHRLYAVAPG
jgi:adenylate cyclase